MTSLNENASLSSVKIELPENSQETSNEKPKVETPPDKGWAWVVAIASLFASMISDGVIFSFGVITPEFIKHFGVSRSTVGWMGSLLISVTLCVGPLASFLCQKFSYRTVAVAGSIIAATNFALPFFCSQLWLLFLCTSVLCGVGFGLVYFPSIVIVNVWFEAKRSLAMGIAVCGSGLGTFILSPLQHYLIVTFGWQLTMLITGIFLLFMVPCCMTYKNRIGEASVKEKTENIPEDSTNNDEKIEGQSKDIELNKNESLEPSNNVSENSTKATFVELLKNPILWLFIISNIMTSIGFNTPYMFTKDRAILQGFSEEKASYLISAIGIGNCAGRLIFGYLATLKCVNRFHVYNLTLVVSGLILVISWFIHNYILMMMYNIIFGVMTGPYMVLLSIILVDIFGLQNLDNTLSLTLMAQGLAVLVGPPISGWIFDLTHSFNVTFAVCGICIDLSGLVMYFSYLSKDFRKKKFNLTVS